MPTGVSINVELPTVGGADAARARKVGGADRGRDGRDAATRIDDAARRREAISHPRRGFAPAGQSTQMIVGADAATDGDIVGRASGALRRFALRRVYYSAFSPIPDASAVLPLQAPAADARAPALPVGLADALLRLSRRAEVAAAADPRRACCRSTSIPSSPGRCKFRDALPGRRQPRASASAAARAGARGEGGRRRSSRRARWRRLRLEDVARLTGSIAKVRPFIIADDWRPTLLTDSAGLRETVAPRARQLDLFAA